MSPSETYSSSLSEVSTPNDTSSVNSMSRYQSTYSPYAVDTIDPFTYETVAKQVAFHREKLSRSEDSIDMSFGNGDQAMHCVSYAQPMKNYELTYEDQENDEEVIQVHPSLMSQQISPPQEVEFPTETASTPMEETTPRQRKRVRHVETDDEQDLDEDDTVAVDDRADSDWTVKPKAKRRRSSRGSAARASKPTLHKRGTSITKSFKKELQDPLTGELPPAKHRRQSSKGKKLPKFAIKEPQLPLEKKDRSFPCTFHHFGCQSVFPNKNEWKRHVACQHLQLGFYRCDLDRCNPDHAPSAPSSRRAVKKEEEEERTVIYNDFNRKDLFTQHARRMHGPSRNASLCSTLPTKKGLLQPTKEDEAAFEEDLLEIRRRCWQTRRKAPSRSSCGICDRVFDTDYVSDISGKSNSGGSMSQGPGEKQGPEERAWEERMEHVGRHYEKSDYKDQEKVDDDLALWGLQTGVLIRLPDGKPWLANLDRSSEIGYGKDNKEELRKTRRQPSRTVVKQSFKVEREDVDEQVVVTDEDEDAPADSE